MQLDVRELNHFPRYSWHEGKGESVQNGELPGRHLLSHSGLCNREGARTRRRRRRWWKTMVRKHALRETVGPSFRRFNCFVLAVREGRTERESEPAPERAPDPGGGINIRDV